WVPTASKSHTGFGKAGVHSTLVRLEFVPIDQRRFAVDHPNLQRYYGRQNNYGAYRIPLGPGAGAVAVFDETLRGFAQGRYRGVVDEGIAWGFRYSRGAGEEADPPTHAAGLSGQCGRSSVSSGP